VSCEIRRGIARERYCILADKNKIFFSYSIFNLKYRKPIISIILFISSIFGSYAINDYSFSIHKYVKQSWKNTMRTLDKTCRFRYPRINPHYRTYRIVAPNESLVSSRNVKTGAWKKIIFAVRAEDSRLTNFKLHSKDSSSDCRCREERVRPCAATPSSVSLNLYRRGRLFTPCAAFLLKK